MRVRAPHPTLSFGMEFTGRSGASILALRLWQQYHSAMGFSSTRTLDTTLPRDVSTRRETACSPKPSWGPIFSVVSGLRFYGPELGRWVSRDPLHERGFATQFSSVLDVDEMTVGQPGLRGNMAFLSGFCDNRPINEVDVLGLGQKYDCFKKAMKGCSKVSWCSKIPCLTCAGCMAIPFPVGLACLTSCTKICFGVSTATTVICIVDVYNNCMDEAEIL